ncbi:MAG: hypothetical protein LPK80_02425 [Bacteroidota bacterium]|nr:hypothetical protein [Bacteroidota bacterium]MDX5428464.1 hypothetical protein [Bacteroidota bacterium]
MNKTKIKLVTLGQLPVEFNRKVIQNHKSGAFELAGQIEAFSLNCDSDGENWEFSDILLSGQLPSYDDCDFLIAISNVPLEDNYYTRRLENNKIIFTFHEIREYFNHENIPLENMILRLLYGYSLVYRRSGNRIPEIQEFTNFTHDETRGCLFDMNGIKSDIVKSCVKPIICPECVLRLESEMVSTDYIQCVKKEISKIRKKLFYRISDYVKSNPIRALLISGLAAILLGTIGSIIGSWVYEHL